MALAFSGGVDSSYLLAVASGLGIDVKPYIVRMPFNKTHVVPDAIRFCEGLGIEPVVVDLDILSIDDVVSNGSDRCYICKRVMFMTLVSCAKRDGYATVIDGTNASDLPEERPGMRALGELGIISPMRECGITKQEIRDHSRELGLTTWNMPSDSCLATRVLTGNLITDAVLGNVEEAESRLASHGYIGCRVRTDGQVCMVEFREEDHLHAMERSDTISELLGDLFNDVSISDVRR